MRNQQIIVHCVYQDSEKTISEILMESFRLYLSRILQNDVPVYYTVRSE